MDNKGKKIGLALSGGGYRAAAYHIGSLRALHRLGILDKVNVISSVSGGSITAAYYALHKDNYEDFEEGFIKRLSKGVLWSSYIYLVVAVCLLFAMSAAMGHLIGFLTRVLFPNEFILRHIGRCDHLFYPTRSFSKVFVCDVTNQQLHLALVQQSLL